MFLFLDQRLYDVAWGGGGGGGEGGGRGEGGKEGSVREILLLTSSFFLTSCG